MTCTISIPPPTALHLNARNIAYINIASEISPDIADTIPKAVEEPKFSFSSSVSSSSVFKKFFFGLRNDDFVLYSITQFNYLKFLLRVFFIEQ